MDAILFIAMFVCLGIVAGWYVGNEVNGAKGQWGLLSIRDGRMGAEAPPARRYFAKQRVEIERSRPTFNHPETDDEAEGAARYRDADGAKFRDKDEKSYRSRGPLPTLSDRKPRA